MPEVVDFHVRLARRPGAVERLEAVLDQAGVDRAVVVAGGVVRPEVLSRQLIEDGHSTADADNEAVLAAAQASGGRLVPTYFGNPHTGPDAYLSAGSAYAGLELSPAVHGVAYDDPRLGAWVDASDELGRWVYSVAINRPGCRVSDFVALADRHPDIDFVLGHLGYGNIDYHGMRLAAAHPNVLVETSGGYSTVLADAIELLGPERVLFGSEFPLQHPRVELTKVDVLDLDVAVRTALLGGNALRILKESACPLL